MSSSNLLTDIDSPKHIEASSEFWDVFFIIKIGNPICATETILRIESSNQSEGLHKTESSVKRESFDPEVVTTNFHVSTELHESPNERRLSTKWTFPTVRTRILRETRRG